VEAQKDVIVLRGLSPDTLHRRACRSFDQRLGERRWTLTEQRFTPCLVTIGGRVRLYEGRFEAAATS
jgi:hypothetical protein